MPSHAEPCRPASGRNLMAQHIQSKRPQGFVRSYCWRKHADGQGFPASMLKRGKKNNNNKTGMAGKVRFPAQQKTLFGFVTLSRMGAAEGSYQRCRRQETLMTVMRVLTAEQQSAEHQKSSQPSPDPIHSPHGRSHPLWSDSASWRDCVRVKSVVRVNERVCEGVSCEG